MLAHKTAEPDSKPARSLRGTRSTEAGSGVPVSGQEPRDSAEVFAVDQVNASFLESLLGYNARRASLALVGVFMRCMERYDLKIVEFSVLSLAGHNGIEAVFMTGGTSYVPAVRALFDRRFCPQRIHIGDAFRSVASGLALLALDRQRALAAA